MFHVLVVEDNPSDVLLIREAISTSSIPTVVTVAYDGQQALRILEDPTPPPDLIILNLNLPRVGGLEILQRHLLNGDTPPVVVFTSSQRLDEGARAIALGASDFIVKPVTWDEYFNAIRDVVERWGRRVQR